MIRKCSKGFTMVELIVVIAIIGILAVVLVPQYIKYIEESRTKVCEADRSELMHAYDIERTGSENDAASAMAAVLAQYGGTGLKTETLSTGYQIFTCTGLCPSSSTAKLTVALRADGSVFYTECSRHGTLDGGILEGDSSGTELPVKKLLETAAAQGAEKRVDSTSTSGEYIDKVNEVLKSTGYSLGEYNINSWALEVDNKKVWLTDQDVSKAALGTYVRVLQYDEKAKNYKVGYMRVDSKKYNYATYNVLTDKYGETGGATWTETFSTDEYSKALLAYRTLEATKTTIK